MAIFFAEVSHRTIAAHQPGAILDYISRAGRYEGMTDVQARGMQMPAWAEGDPYQFFAMAAAHERVNGRWATMWVLTLPRELTHGQRVELTEAFLAAQLPDKGYYWVMHNHRARDGGEQPHLHILWNERAMDTRHRQQPQDCFRRYNAKYPAQGGWQKDPWWTSPRSLYALRAGWAECANYALERAGSAARIYPGRIPDRQTRRDPEKLAKAATAAQAWWEYRKGQYGPLPGTIRAFAVLSTARTRQESLGYQRRVWQGQTTEGIERQIRLLTARLSTVNREGVGYSRKGFDMDLYEQDQAYHPMR